MDIMTPDILDRAREYQGSGSHVVLVTGQGEASYPWNDTDAEWESILAHITHVVGGAKITACAVITEGVDLDNETYEMREHSNMVVVHRAGHQCYKVPFGDGEVVLDLGERPVHELDFDLAALRSVLWS